MSAPRGDIRKGQQAVQAAREPETTWADGALRLLARAGRVLGASLDYQGTLTGLTHFLVPDLADVCAIYVISPEGEPVQVETSATTAEADRLAHELLDRFPPDIQNPNSLVAQALRTGRPALQSEVGDDFLQSLARSPEHLALLRAQGWRSYMVAPMSSRNRVFGLIGAVVTHSPRIYGQEDLALLQEIANRAAIAVDNAQLYESEREARREAERSARTALGLYDIASALGKAQSSDTIARLVVDESRAVTGARGSFFAMADESGGTIAVRYARGFPGDLIARYSEVPLGAALPMTEVLRTGEPIEVASSTELVRRYPGLEPDLEAIGPGPLIVLPVVLDGRIFGAAGFVFGDGYVLQPEERLFLVTLTRQAAQALDRARLARISQLGTEQLRVALAKLDAVLDAVPVGIGFLDSDLRFVRANAALARIDGLAPEDYPGRTLHDVVPELAAILEERYRRVLQTGEPILNELIRGRSRLREGSWLVSYYPMRDPDGSVQWIGTSVLDVTERERSADALRRRERELAALLEGAPDIIARFDSDLRYVYVNPAMERYTGLPASEFLGRTNAEIGHFAALAERWETALREVFSTGHATEFEFAFEYPESRGLRWFHARIVPEPASDDEVATVLGIAHEITEHRRIESQLAQAEKMDALGRLSGGVAHEVNNMMSVILGFTDLLLTEPDFPVQWRDDLLEIQRATQRAAYMSRQLLAYTRRGTIVPELLRVDALLEELPALLQPHLGPDVQLWVEPRAGDARVRADPIQLRQVFVNLADNANDAMPRGGVLRITSGTRELGEQGLVDRIGAPIPPGPYAVVQVSDTGAGMDAETAARAFEPFFTTKAPGEGTGLGLSMVYGIIKQSGGYVYIESALGQGTTVTVLLPEAIILPA